MIIWTYNFEDKTRLELIRPLTGTQLLKMWEKHGYVVVGFKEVDYKEQIIRCLR